MANKKVQTILRTLGGIVVFAGIVAGTILVQKNQDIREKAAPATSLFFSPSSQETKPGNSLSMNVVMDTGENQVTGMDLEITFNPSVFQITSISQGSGISNFDQEIKNEIDNVNGKILYSVFTIDKSKAVNGSGIQALDISFDIDASAGMGSYSFAFGGITAVSATDEGQDVVSSLSPATINISKIGDVNGDGTVNIVDIGVIVDNYFSNPITDSRADLNDDSTINIIDIGIVVDNYEL